VDVAKLNKAYMRRKRFNYLPTLKSYLQSMRESLKLAEPRKKARFSDMHEVVNFEDHECRRRLWFTKADKARALEEALEEVLVVGGLARWKSMEWIK